MGRDAIWVYNRFMTIIDRAGDPSIEDNEFSNQYNASALDEFKDDFGNIHTRGADSNNSYAFEMSDTDTVKWQPLIKEPFVLTSDINGKITIAAIEAAITGRIYHIQFARKDSTGTYQYCRFVRHNDYGRVVQNSFVKPKDNRPIWVGFDTYYSIEPAAERDVKMTVVKYPSELVLDFTTPANNKPTDLTDSAIESVLWRMAERYGIQIREQQLVQNAAQQEVKQ